jgi:cytosine deaminase
MPAIDMLFTGARLAGGETVAIAVAAGRIAAIGPDLPAAPLAETVDLGGALVVPGFVEGHIHLDTSYVGDAWQPHIPCTAGFDVHERIAFQKRQMAKAAPIDVRARDQLELCLAHGTTHMRSHVNVDAAVGMKHLEAILPVREEYRDRIDIQLVAFPQNGILACPGTAELLDEAIAMGCDLIGGLDPATIDRDVERQLDVVFAIAEKRGVDVDIHLHEPHMLGVFQIEQIAARTVALGMQGHVAVSHAYGLGEVPIEIARRTAAKLAAAGVAIMTNAPGSHPFPPVALLRAEGVTVFSGNDNIRDSWWPYGDGDMLMRANIIGYRSGFYTDDELTAALDVVTRAGAKALRLEGYGLAPGAWADFVALEALHPPEAVVGVPKRRASYKRGRLVAKDLALAG